MKKLIRGSQNFSTLPKQIATKWAILNLINESKKNEPEAVDLFELYEMPEQIEANVDEDLLTFSTRNNN